ncbi:epoxide hydrolase [Moniliophthora roreri]|nr:epoxide hydrolase [Moniliophthora roreri]
MILSTCFEAFRSVVKAAGILRVHRGPDVRALFEPGVAYPAPKWPTIADNRGCAHVISHVWPLTTASAKVLLDIINHHHPRITFTPSNKPRLFSYLSSFFDFSLFDSGLATRITNQL